MATEIIRKLKRKIRIMWAIIISLVLLLFATYNGKTVISHSNKADNTSFVTGKTQKIYYSVPESDDKNNQCVYKKKRKRNVE